MSDLQIVLIILGAIIIAGVVIYNWLQERKLRENITDEFIVPQKDVLVEEFYVDTDALIDKEFDGDAHKGEVLSKLNDDKKEPTLDESALEEATTTETLAKDEVENQTAAQDEVEQVASPSIEEAMPEIEVHKDILPPEFEPAATTSLPDEIHAHIDLTAFLYAPKNIEGAPLYEVTKNTLKDIEATIFYHGLDEKDVWHVIDSSPAEGVSYKQIAYSMQLADRRGSVPKPMINKFQFAVETIGLEFNAHVEWQDSGDPAKRAIELDKFCMDVDQLVSVHLMQGDTPIHGTKFRGMAEANGLKLKHSRFCYFEDAVSDQPLFILINADNQPFTVEGLRSDIVRGATFQIEIPKVNNCEEVFNEMIAIAQKMANSLGARIVDDNQRPLGDLQIEKIRQQLKMIHATMLARGIMPGSANSMRLFN